jgi:hypothetical protein
VQRIKLTAVSNRKVYSLGAPVMLDVSIENLLATQIVLTLDPPVIDLVSRESGQEEIVKTFDLGMGQTVLGPAGKVTYTLAWDQRDHEGKQVPPGYYFFYLQPKGDIRVNGDEDGVSAAFGVLIRPLPESGERVLRPDQSLSAKGSTFTVERIELSSTGTKIYASLKPADPRIFVRLFEAEAEYSIDGGPLITADRSEILFHEFHLWSLPPVPADAQELHFNILRYGERVLDKVEGPWEFTIPLDSDSALGRDVTFSQLISEADRYNGRNVTLEAFYFLHRSDLHVIADSAAPAPSGEGKVIPAGTQIRVWGGEILETLELLNQLYSQEPFPGMSPHYQIHFGKVRMTGKFETGAKESDPLSREYRITIISVEVLEWTPPLGGTASTEGNLQINVKNLSNKPLEGAGIISTRQPDGQPELRGLADAGGNVTFTGVKQGSYEFTVTLKDYSPIDIKVTVTGGRTADYAFFMAWPDEAPDDLVPTPGYGPAYRANVLAGRGDGTLVLNPWPRIESAEVTRGTPPDTVEIMYRDHIETKAGQTRNNLFTTHLLDVDDPGESGFGPIEEVILKGVDVPSGITATQDWQQGGPYFKTLLKIAISPDVQPGEYTFNVNVAVNGKDYGTVPCTVKVLEHA